MSQVLSRAFVAAAVVGIAAAPAWPCSVVGPRPSPQQLVDRAEVIVRVRAERLADGPGRPASVMECITGEGEVACANLLTASPTRVRFTVLEVLKGQLASTLVESNGTLDQIEFNGTLSDRDDRNDRPVPYDFIRPGGRGGNCYALTYRLDADYLLLLARIKPLSDAQPAELTPYWAPLSPTNEQLLGGAADAWLIWVVQRLRAR
jgi:hypothetical protein